MSESSNTAGGASFAGGFLELSVALGVEEGVMAEENSSKSLIKMGTEEGEKSCECETGKDVGGVAAASGPLQRNKKGITKSGRARRRNMRNSPSRLESNKEYAKRKEKQNETNWYIECGIQCTRRLVFCA